MYALSLVMLVAVQVPKDDIVSPTFTLKWIGDIADKVEVDEENELAVKEASREFQERIRKALAGKDIEWGFSVQSVKADSGKVRVIFFPAKIGERVLWFKVGGSVDFQVDGPNMPVGDAYQKWAVKLNRGSVVILKSKIKRVEFLAGGEQTTFPPRILSKVVVIMEDRWEAYPYRRR